MKLTALVISQINAQAGDESFYPHRYWEFRLGSLGELFWHWALTYSYCSESAFNSCWPSVSFVWSSCMSCSMEAY